MPSVAEIPQTWLLGSSPGGSNLAAELGIGYTFAGFINPPAAAAALRNYRSTFRPQGFGLTSPKAILAVNVTVGETTEDAARLVASPNAYYARLGRGDFRTLVPSADEAARELSRADRDEPTTIESGRWPKFVAGDPRQIRATLEQMAAESGVDELMVQNMIPAVTDRHHSHTLLAEAFGLPAKSPSAA